MPSGAKKRKAAKKKLQKDTHNTTRTNGSHSQGANDAKSHDERDSDGGEIEREENVVNNHEEGAKEVSLGEENFEVAREEKQKEEGFKDVTVDSDDVARDFRNGDHRSSSSSSSDDDEVAVEKEKSVVAEVGEVEQQAENSLQEPALSSEGLKPSEYVAEEAPIGSSVMSEVVGKSFEESIPNEESVKQVVSLPQEFTTVAESASVENLSTSDVIESGLEQHVDKAVPMSDEKSKISSEVPDMVQEKVEEKLISVEDGGSGEQSESVGITSREVEGLLPQSSGVKAVNGCSEDDNVKESETHKYEEEQPLVSSAPLPVRRTSWMNCCGLFEVFSGGSSR